MDFRSISGIIRSGFVAGLLFSMLVPIALHAQESAYKTEASAFVGVQHFSGPFGGDTHPQFGGSFGVMLGKNSVLSFEPSYLLGGSGQNLLNLAGSLDVGFKTKSEKLVPFVSALGGYARVSGTDFSNAENGASFGAGFGVRYFIADNWGLKPEFAWLRLQQVSGGDNTLIFRIGIFRRSGQR